MFCGVQRDDESPQRSRTEGDPQHAEGRIDVRRRYRIRFDLTGASVSYHLAQLKKAGLVNEKKDKNYIYYSLNASVVEEVLLWLQSLKGEDGNEK